MANYQLQDAQKAPYAFFDQDADGNVESPEPGDLVTLTSSDTASLTIAPDSTPDPTKYPAGTPAGVTALQTGFLVGGSKLQTGVQVSAQLELAAPPPTGQPVVPPTSVDIVAGPVAGGGLSIGQAVSQ
jgi:hypothetical protein